MNKELFNIGNKKELIELKSQIIKSHLDTSLKRDFLEYIESDADNAMDSLRTLLYDFLAADSAIKFATECNNINDWIHMVVEHLSPSIKKYTNKQIDLAMGLILYEQSIRDPEYNSIFCRFTELYKSDGGVF